MTTFSWFCMAVWGAIVTAWQVILIVQHRVKRQRMIVQPIDRRALQAWRDGQRSIPTVTVVIPARNESAGLRTCLDAVLAQTYPRLSAIVVDDRSDDNTADVARAIARNDYRVHLERIRQTPTGWLGNPTPCIAEHGPHVVIGCCSSTLTVGSNPARSQRPSSRRPSATLNC